MSWIAEGIASVETRFGRVLPLDDPIALEAPSSLVIDDCRAPDDGNGLTSNVLLEVLTPSSLFQHPLDGLSRRLIGTAHHVTVDVQRNTRLTVSQTPG